MFDQFFHDVFDNNFGGILILTENLEIKHMNKAAEKITGFLESEAVGKFCYEILRARRCKGGCPIQAVRNGEKQGEFVVDILDRDNATRYIKTRIIHTHGYWVEIFSDITREVELEKQMKGTYKFEDIITQDKGLIDILSQFPRIASSLAPVLLEGESGVGKEVFATALQALSGRKQEPFVKMNCAALPESLLESELFGYKKGAFTDARKDKPGLFATAHRGTLFLDEIGEMSLPLQAKLLRAVERGEIFPLGGTLPLKVDVRLLAATNKDLYGQVRTGHFREDLYYRLNVVTIRIPPLRERKNDIPLFIDHFVENQNLIQQKIIQGVSKEAMQYLLEHDYPGNIRELRNIMEYAFIFCDAGEILPEHLPEYIRRPGDYAAIKPAGRETGAPGKAPVTSEKQYILQALEKAGWKKAKAAEILGIDRSTLWRKMKKYGL